MRSHIRLQKVLFLFFGPIIFFISNLRLILRFFLLSLDKLQYVDEKEVKLGILKNYSFMLILKMTFL